MTRVYLDACCLNRPFDDQSQDRIRLEAEAVILVLARLEARDWSWIGSDVLDLEIDQIPDPERRGAVGLLASFAHEKVQVGAAQIERGCELQRMGFQSFDSLHLACAEGGRVDVFLTTDDQLLRLAGRSAPQLQVRVENPLAWLREVTKQ